MSAERPMPEVSFTPPEKISWLEIVDKGPAVVEPKRITPGHTSEHEATHAVLGVVRGKLLIEANRIKQGNDLGTTSLSSFDEVAAVGPDAVGMGGTSWDMFLAKMRGVNISAAKEKARGLIGKFGKLISAVASRIEEKGRIGHFDVLQEAKELDKREERKDDRIVDLVVHSEGGPKKIGSFETKNNIIVFPGASKALIAKELDQAA